MYFLHRFIANAALGHVYDPFEREVVGGLIDDTQIGDGVANFGALVRAKTANYPIVNANLYEAVFKFTRLMLRAHEDGDAVEGFALILHGLDFLTDAASLFGTIPYADDPDFFTVIQLGPQCLAQPRAVGINQP